MSIKNFNNFTWWLNLIKGTDIADSDFVITRNMKYNNAHQIQSKLWYKKFGNEIWSSPVTSYFFYQRDDTLARIALCVSWTQMYSYNEWTGLWVSIKTWLTEFETNLNKVWQRTRWDFAVYKNIVYMCNWVDKYASYDGTTYTEYPAQPKIRYIQYLWDRIFWAWDDSNPITLYYTAAAPANANTINGNLVVVWWDETWIINWLNEYSQIVLVFKSNKIYAVNVAANTVEPIDSQTWWYSDRTIFTVWNSLVYLNERWIDSLIKRDWVSWTSAIESSTLSDKVRELTKMIKPIVYNSNVWRYNKPYNNYYFTFDTNSDDSPDSTLVYNSTVKSWTQYILPEIYDYGIYIDSSGNKKYIFTSALWWQCYEYEVWYQDDWQDYSTMIETKPFDFGDSLQLKNSEFVDLTWWKQKWWDILIEILWDWDVLLDATITDSNLDLDWDSQRLWIYPEWRETMWAWSNDIDEDIELFPYTVRVPMYEIYNTISIRMSATWVQWILDRMRIQYNWWTKEIFNYNNIL